MPHKPPFKHHRFPRYSGICVSHFLTKMWSITYLNVAFRWIGRQFIDGSRNSGLN